MNKRALLSVSDKTGIADFARELSNLGFEIISTGGTAKAIRDAGVPATEVADLTGFPECLDGRVKTLHPMIHGGLLAVRSNACHMEQMQNFGVYMIDLIAVNLYPFKRTITRPGVSLAEAIEQIDIGGPAMLRSAAKNYQDVAVVSDPQDYARIIEALKNGGGVPLTEKFRLARKAFEHTAAYDALIAGYLGRCPLPVENGAGAVADNGAIAQTDNGAGDFMPAAYFPGQFSLTYELKQNLRYGENPHQSAAFYADPIPATGSLATYKQLHGKELSYNNIGDLDGALSLLAEFDAPAAVAVKHANPCGVATAANIYDAYIKAYETDTESVYGGVVALNRPVDARTAAEIRKIFIEIVAAPAFDDDALALLSKKKNIRLLVIDMPAGADVRDAEYGAARPDAAPLFYKKVGGGLLVQTRDDVVVNKANIQYVTKKIPTEEQLADMIFAMTVVKHTKSNAIVLAKNMSTIGVGPGQNSRISAAKIAIAVAGARAKGAVAASDAFMPFGDCVEAFASAGVEAVIQPGGSVNDDVSIEACDRLGIAMAFTGLRHFRH